MRNLINLFVLSICLCFMAQNAAAQTQVQLFNQLYAKIDAKRLKIDRMEFNSTTIRKDSNRQFPYGYTGHENTTLYATPDGKLHSFIYTNFSDRDNFNGETDRQELNLYLQNGQIKGKMTLLSWGKAIVTLTNIKIHKRTFGYYITAESSNGRSNTFYTMAVFDTVQTS